MRKNKKFDEMSDKIIEYIGGKENISFCTYCMTRLRFNLKDINLAQVKEIDQLEGVMGYQWQGDQLQIIIGSSVEDVYKLICEKTNLAKEDLIMENIDGVKKKISIGTLIEGIAGCVQPLLPVLIGAGMLKVILILGELSNILIIGSGTHTVLSFASDAGFYFLPVFAGMSSAKKFNTNQGLGMLIGAILIHPAFASATLAGSGLSVFGIPVYLTTYASTLLPTILSVFVMSYVQRFIGKHSPEAIRTLSEPLLTLLVMIPLTLCLIGPIGSYAGVYFSEFVMWLYKVTGFFGVAVLSAVMPFIMMTGMMHAGFIPYMMQSLTAIGYEPIVLTAMMISNINQGAASAAVAVKSKIKSLRATAGSCAVTAMIGGITEPAMYGVNMKLKTPMWAAMIGSFVGAGFAGLMNVCAYTFPGSGGFLGLTSFLGDNSMNIIYMVIGVVIGLVVTFIMTLILYKEEIQR